MVAGRYGKVVQDLNENTIDSLFKTWEDCVADFLDAGSDPVKLQSFYNLTLGLPFEETVAGVELYKVRQLRDEHRPNNVVPNDALFLVGACDIQDDRLEIEIKAFGDRWRSWGIDHRIIKGYTSDPLDNCWNELYKIKDEVFFYSANAELLNVECGRLNDKQGIAVQQINNSVSEANANPTFNTQPSTLNNNGGTLVLAILIDSGDGEKSE
jgi:hypothetical protein